MEPLITVPDLAARLGVDFTSAQTAQATVLIDDASALVRDIAGEDFIDPVTGFLTVPASIIPVVVAIVRRALNNPMGYTGENMGDYGWQMNIGSQPASVFPTRNEKRVIRRAVSKFSAGSVALEGYYPYSNKSDDLTIN